MDRQRRAVLAVDLADAARRDLTAIDLWTRNRFGVAMARQYARHIITLLKRIATGPSDWASRPEPGWGHGVRSMSIRIVFPRGQHRAIYRVEAQRIVVIRIVHLASAHGEPPAQTED